MKGLIIGLSICICLYSSFFYYNCKKNSEKKITKSISKQTQTDCTKNNDAENNEIKDILNNETENNDAENNDAEIKDILNDIVDKVLEEKKTSITFIDDYEVIN